jgi:hypothetical protein
MPNKSLNILLTLVGLALVILMLYVLDQYRRADLSRLPDIEPRTVQPPSELKN